MLVRPSVFVMLRSAVGVMTVLLSVAELFPAGSLVPAGGVIVAVFVIVPEPAMTALGPALLATIVYVSVPPAFPLVRPSVFVMLRSAVAVMTVLLSVAEL